MLSPEMPVCSHVLLSKITCSFLTFTNKTQWFLSESSAPQGFLFFPLLLPVNPFYALELEDDILLHHVRQHHNFVQQTISNLVKQTELNKDRQPGINKGSALGPARQAQSSIIPKSQADMLGLEWSNPCRLTALPVMWYPSLAAGEEDAYWGRGARCTRARLMLCLRSFLYSA